MTIILADAHKNYKSVHRVTIIAHETWENFSFERQKLMVGKSIACIIQPSAYLKSYKGSQLYN